MQQDNISTGPGEGFYGVGQPPPPTAKEGKGPSAPTPFHTRDLHAPAVVVSVILSSLQGLSPALRLELLNMAW